MSSVDYVVIAIVALSTLIGLWRGFVREALSLLIWVAAFWIAYAGASSAEPWFNSWISDHSLRLVSAFVVLFMAVHVAGFVISRLLSALIESIGLGGVNRVAGGGFGMARGVLLMVAVVLVVRMTPLATEPSWQGAYTIGLISKGLAWVQHYYPLDIKSAFPMAQHQD